MAEREHHTFLFADIAGYSLVADESGDEAAAELALYFLSRASTLAAVRGGEVIKSLGDAVMVHIEDAAESIQLGLDLVSEFGQDAALPPLHAGLHTGPAVSRADDWWGATVNIAARVAAAATAGQLLVTDATRREAGRIDSMRWRCLEPLRLKNIRSPVPVYTASRIPCRHAAHGLVIPLDRSLPATHTVTA